MKLSYLWLITLAFACKGKPDATTLPSEEDPSKSYRDGRINDQDTDTDGDTYLDANDCAPRDGKAWQFLRYSYRDLDRDGFTVSVNPANVCSGASLPVTYSDSLGRGSDCDDGDAKAFQKLPYKYRDEDGDEYTVGSEGTVCAGSQLPAGYLQTESKGLDCNDRDADLKAAVTFAKYQDGDGDGLWLRESKTDCTVPAGYGALDSTKDASLENPLTLARDDDFDNDGTITQQDCAPLDALKWQNLTYSYRDADGDGWFIDSNGALCTGMALPAGYGSLAGQGLDCDDSQVAYFEVQNYFRYSDLDADGKWYRESQSVCVPALGFARADAVKDASLETPLTSAMDSDADNDGVGDAQDQCPGTPDSGRAIRYKLLDADGDGAADGSSSQMVCPSNTEFTLQLVQVVITDCAPGDVNRWQSLAFSHRDSDGDGYTVSSSSSICSGNALPQGYQTQTGLGTDCDDSNSSYVTVQTYYQYADGDGDGLWYRQSQSTCVPASGFGPTVAAYDALLEVPQTLAADSDFDNDTILTQNDCDDADASLWQLLPFTFRDFDNDGYKVSQSGSICSGSNLPTGYFTSNAGTLDCDDVDPERHVMTGYSYIDQDLDGYYTPASGLQCGSAMALPMGYSSSAMSIWQTTLLDSDDAQSANLPWVETQRFPTGHQLQSLAGHSNLLVGVGINGAIVTSSDGLNWTARFSNTSNNLNGVAYGNNLFVAVGSLGTIVTSSDGINWTLVSPPSGLVSATFNSVVFAGSTFIAVGNSGAIMSSSNGTTWVQRSSPLTRDLTAITHTGSLYVAVGRLGTVLSSPTGVSWTSINIGHSTNLQGVAFGNGIYTAVGANGVILSSSNGTAQAVANSWTSVSSGTTQNLVGVTFINSLFVATGASGTVLSSANGAGWSAVSPTGTSSQQLQTAAYFKNLYVAVGASGNILSTPDLSTWTDRTSGSASNLNSIAYGAGRYVAVGARGTILSSTDGTTWTQQNSGVSNVSLNSVSFGQNTFVAVGSAQQGAATVLSSADGVTWTARTSGTPYSLNAVTYGNGLFIAVGDTATIITSHDGMNWSAQNTDVSASFYGVIYGNSQYAVVGSQGTILISSDAQSWSNQTPSSFSGTLYGIAFGNSRYIATADAGKVWTSFDGVEWTERSSGLTASLTSIAHNNGMFLALGPTGLMTSSVDGVQWARKSIGTYNGLGGVVLGPSGFFVVGAAGTILKPQ